MDDPLFSPAFFWIWNAPLRVGELCAQLEDMRAHGIRNVCIHPFPKGFRPGTCPSEMAPDYLTPEFLDVFAAVVRRAGELGMHAYLYDEGGWPSGGACGHVAASDPEGRFAPREITSTAPEEGGASPPGEPLPLAARRDGSPYPGGCVLGARPYGVGGPTYPSLLEPGAARRFLELTHEAYAARLGADLGTTVRVAFTDEPDMPHDVPGQSLAWASDFDAEFRRRKGYDIVPHVPALLADPEGTDPALSRFRVDVQDVKADLFVERFLAPLRDWCRAHGILSGGHLNNEDQPECEAQLGHGNLLRSLRAMDVPGVDVIWRQLFPECGAPGGRALPDSGGASRPGEPVGAARRAARPAFANPFPRYASSAMHQNGGRFALSESFAIFGDSLTPDEMKWVVDYQFVRGVNLYVFAYFAQSNARHWMTLFEPHFGPDAPTWDFLPHFFRYMERTSRFLSQGRPGAEIAVLMNNRAFWAGKADRKAATAAHYAVATWLDEANCDYDFVEDRDIATAETTADGKLRIGSMEYRAIVLPSEGWMLDEAKASLSCFKAAGGIVASGTTQLDRVPRTLRISGDGARAIRVMKRIDGDRRIWFLMNEDMTARTVEITFPDAGPIVRYDPETDVFESVSSYYGGILRRTFLPGETAIYVTGHIADLKPRSDDLQARRADLILNLSSGWSLRPLVFHVAGAENFELRQCDTLERPVALGDWRPVLGETFCGKSLYRVEFDSPTEGDALLDLGEVKWCAAVRFNGADLGARFFGPFRWAVHVAQGRNTLEVSVANLLANQVGDDAIRDRVLRDWRPNGCYDNHQRPFDKHNHESGFFGPVVVRYFPSSNTIRKELHECTNLTGDAS
ncbi:MAG: hypothetical protein IKH04_03860 [Kiritimatiellae bacterium]|nr:hypothetical protein [Kiritimatiellia bacterium]